MDLMALLNSAAPTGTGPSLPGLALGREEAGFDAVLDQVVAQIAALLVPVTPTVTPETPTLPGLALGFAPADAGEVPVPGTDHTNLVAPNLQLPTTAAPEAHVHSAIPTFVPVASVAAPSRPTTDAPTGPPVPTGKHHDDAPVVEQPPVTDALIAAIRVGLGLPSTIPAPPVASTTPTATPATPGAVTPETKVDGSARPEHAVAAGRTGVMPTLPEHARAALPTPPGISRRFPAPTVTPPVAEPDGFAPPTLPVNPALVDSDGFAPPTPPVNPAIVDSDGVALAPNPVSDVAVETPVVAANVDSAPVLTDLPDTVGLPTMPVLPDGSEAIAPTTAPTVPALPDLPETIALPTTPVAVAVAPNSATPAPTPDAADEPAPVGAESQITGVPMDESEPTMAAANADHTPVPVFDETPPTQEERLSAIAPPLVSSSDEAVDNNETIDTLAAPHDDAPAQTAAVTQTNATRPERADRTERVHEANGLAAPLRTALRDRAANRRDDGFELTIRLDPPELGAVRVRVFTQGDNVKITLHAENPEARAVLQDRRDDVKTLLRNEGFNLDAFDVETNDSRQREPEQSNRRRATMPAAPQFDEPQLQDDGALRL